MRRLSSLIVILCLCLSAQAQYKSTQPPSQDSLSRTSFKATQLIAPGILMASGTVIHCFAHESVDSPIRECAQNEWKCGKPNLTFDDYILYVPMAMHLGLGLTGVESEHCFVERAAESAIGHLALGILSGGMKEIINSPRPNGRNNQSFPSGHTDLCFFNAELVRMEYGWAWGAGAYAVATTVGIMRIYNDWHWTSDVIFGAGLGIFCAHLGEWLFEPAGRLLPSPLPEKYQFGFVPVIDPFSRKYGTALVMKM